MEIAFAAVDADALPDDRLASRFRDAWPQYQRWFLSEGESARPRYLSCRRAIREHVPELVKTWERLVDLAGGGDLAARFLSFYRPPRYLAACSQAAWTRDQPFLIRNYDYAPRLWDACVLASRWSHQRVIASTDCFWGVLDGMNEAGLAVSLAFGGDRRVAEGFGVPLLLRHVLENCESVDEAVVTLARIPSHMAYNITLLDRSGAARSMELKPGGGAELRSSAIATNHQRHSDWAEYIRATASFERETVLRRRLADPAETRESFVDAFQRTPIQVPVSERDWMTLYTAVYRPDRLEAEYWLPGARLEESIDRFQELETTLRYVRPLETSESDG